MRHFQAGEGAVTALSFTPDGKSLVAVEVDRKDRLRRAVHWIDLRTGETRRTLDLCEDAWRRSISYAEACQETGDAFVSPNGQWVAVHRYLGDPILLDLWNMKTRKWREIDPGEHNFVVDGVCYSALSDLMIFASGTDGGGTHTLERLDLKTKRRLPAIKYPSPGDSARRLQLAADDSLLAALGYGSVFALPHDRERADAGDSVELELEISDSASIRFSPGGNELAIVDGPQLYFWDCKSSNAVEVNFDGERVNELAYSPEGRLFALGSDDGTVRLHDRATGREVRRYDWRIGGVVSLAFAADGMTVASGGKGGRVVLWDADV